MITTTIVASMTMMTMMIAAVVTTMTIMVQQEVFGSLFSGIKVPDILLLIYSRIKNRIK